MKLLWGTFGTIKSGGTLCQPPFLEKRNISGMNGQLTELTHSLSELLTTVAAVAMKVYDLSRRCGWKDERGKRRTDGWKEGLECRSRSRSHHHHGQKEKRAPVKRRWCIMAYEMQGWDISHSQVFHGNCLRPWKAKILAT